RSTKPVPYSKPASDLGAPLRNRTVDLLLTIDNQSVPVTAVEPLNCSYAGSDELPQAAASARYLGSAPRFSPLARSPEPKVESCCLANLWRLSQPIMHGYRQRAMVHNRTRQLSASMPASGSRPTACANR